MKHNPIWMLRIASVTLMFLTGVNTGLAAGSHRPDTSPSQLTTLAFPISTSADDATQTDGPGGPITLVALSLLMGDNGSQSTAIGFRFANVNIPPGATIAQASLLFTAFDDQGGPMSLSIVGHDTGDSASFGPGDGPADRLADATTSSVLWNPSSWTAGNTYTSPDFASIIQEIVDRPDWVSGGGLSLIISDDTGLDGYRRKAVAYDHDPSASPVLNVTYQLLPATLPLLDGELYLPPQAPLPDADSSSPQRPGSPAEVLAPNLLVTSITMDQVGYLAGSDWQATVEIANAGNAPAGPFSVDWVLGRVQQGGSAITYGPTVLRGEVTILDAGKDATLLGTGDFSSLPLDVSPLYTSALFGLPDNGQVFLWVKVDSGLEVTESNELNNNALTSFTYPTGPANAGSLGAPDSDGDGWIDVLDCQPADPSAYPGAPEIPGDGIDNDCDGLDAGGFIIFVPDSDFDGDGFTPNEGDCNDDDPAVNPGAAEVGFNLQDDDCDGAVDEGFGVDEASADLDQDGFTPADGDCNDLNGAQYPSATEILDGLDNDCDGIIDEGFLEPDWTIAQFDLSRAESGSGINYLVQVENLGDAMGPGTLEAAAGQVQIMDLAAHTFAWGDSGLIFYDQFPGSAYTNVMACHLSGLIAVLPGGLMGDSNNSNNYSIASLDEQGRDMDIAFRTGGSGSAFPYVSYDRSEKLVEVQTGGHVFGTCPPPATIVFSTRVNVLLNGEQVYQDEQVDTGDPDPAFSVTLDSRLHNNDELTIDVLLNSNGLVQEDTSNNHCIRTYRYHSGFLQIRYLSLVESQGCLGYTDGGPGQVGSALTGSFNSLSPGIFIALLAGTLLLAGAGATLGWFVARGLGVSRAVVVVAALAGAAGGALTGAGALAFATRRTPSTAVNVAIKEIDPDSVGRALWKAPVGLIDDPAAPPPISCDAFFDPASAQPPSGAVYSSLKDITLNLDPGKDGLPEDAAAFSLIIGVPGGSTYALVWPVEDGDLPPLNLDIAHLLGEEVPQGVVVWGLQAGYGLAEESENQPVLCLSSTFHAFRIQDGEAQLVEPVKIVPSPTPTPTSTPEATPTFVPTATFTPAPDTQGPKVGGVNDGPDPIFTNGNPPDTATVSALVNDHSGVASVTLYYRLGSKNGFQVWGAMSGSGGKYSTSFGPFGSAGAYQYRIYAVDNLGNANCGKGSIGACPGGTLTVTIP